jgi:ParB family transcriptional regulator, chromosome partitioning protein
MIADGHRRFEVCHLLDIKDIPVLVLPAKPDTETLLLMQLAANGMREDLKPSEKAFAYRRLKEMRNISNAELASLMNVSKSVVTETLSYLDLPSEALALLDSGQIARSTAYAISRAPDKTTRKELLDKAVRGELKRDDAIRRVNRRQTAKHRTLGAAKTNRPPNARASDGPKERLWLLNHHICISRFCSMFGSFSCRAL